MLGGVLAILRGALSVLGSTHDNLYSKVRPGSGLLKLGVALRHRQIARGGGPIARERREIARLCDGVALTGAMQTRAAGLLAPLGCALTDVTGDLVLTRFHASREVAITRGLVAVGSDLVAVGARLVGV